MLRFATFLAILAMATSFHWTVWNNNTRQTCIILESASVTMTVKFTGKNGTVETYNTAINATQEDTGNCQDQYKNQTAQTIKLTFFPNGSETPATTAQPWELLLVFVSVEDKNSFELLDYSLTTAPVKGVNASAIYKFTKTETQIDLQAHDTNAFKCSTTDLPLSNDSVIEMKEVRVIAFAKLDKAEFPKQQIYEQCLLDSRTSDIVPIVVGACLAGLVVIVLVAYLIGRARAKRQGYASV